VGVALPAARAAADNPNDCGPVARRRAVSQHRRNGGPHEPRAGLGNGPGVDVGEIFKKMNSYDILKNIHKVEHPMAAVVLSHEKIERNGHYFCTVEAKANTKFKSIVSLFGKADEFREELIPKRESSIKTVIKNHVDDT
jgi:hypothetical protein